MNSGKRSNSKFCILTFVVLGILFFVAKEFKLAFFNVQPEGIDATQEKKNGHDQAALEIEGKTKNEDDEKDVTYKRTVEKDKKNFEISADRGFWKGSDSVKHHVFDEPLAAALFKFFDQEKITYIIDLGAGMGKYTEYFSMNSLTVNCYDGNPDTQEISNGRCGVVDLTKPIHFNPYDWVLSLEVGEHLPKEFEDVYLANLHSVNTKGAIISWAIEGQDGTGHVNNRKNSYIIEKMEKLGYKYDQNTAEALRSAATKFWFKNTIMVFRKN